MTGQEVKDDWYRAAYTPQMAKLPWAQRTGSEVDRLLRMLEPLGGERILDLGCGTGRHALELARRGFSVVGVEISQANVEVARDAAKAQSLPVEFVQADLRDGRWHREFDVVLSLNDGAIGYFPTEAENRRVFEVISGALKGPGRHVAQIPNVMHVEKSPSGKSRIEGAEAVELVDHHWNSQTRCQEGTITYLGEGFEKSQPIPFRKRLYSVEELRDIYESVGMRLTNLFRGNGKPGRPRNTQYELFLQACKATAP